MCTAIEDSLQRTVKKHHCIYVCTVQKKEQHVRDQPLCRLYNIIHSVYIPTMVFLDCPGSSSFGMSLFHCVLELCTLTACYYAQVKMGDIFKEVTISEATETSLSLFHDISHLDLQSELLSQLGEMQIKTYRLVW